MSFDKFLNVTCAIQTRTEAQDATGQKIQTWANVAGLTAVKCRIDAAGGSERRTPTKIFEQTTHIMFMRNPSAITLSIGTYRIVSGGETYNILLVSKLYGHKDLEHLEVFLEIVK